LFSGVHEEFFDVGECLMRLELPLHWQHVLNTVQSVDDVLVTAGNCKERTGVSDDDERHAVVQDVAV